jgi:hypothetical protein
MSKKVFVSGCYDMLHSGHVAHIGHGNRFTVARVEINSRECTEYEHSGYNHHHNDVYPKVFILPERKKIFYCHNYQSLFGVKDSIFS